MSYTNRRHAWMAALLSLLPATALADNVAAPLTLAAALQEAESNSPFLAAAEHSVAASRRGQAAAERVLVFNPQLEMTARPLVPWLLESSAEVRISQQLELPWVRSARMQQAEKQLRTSEAQQMLTRVELHQRVRAAYAETAWAQEYSEAVEAAWRAAHRRTAAAQSQLTAGEVSNADLRLAQADEAVITAQLREAEQLVLGARAALARWLGRPSPITGPITALAGRRSVGGGAPSGVHPSVAAARADADAAAAEGQRIRMEALPTVRLSVGHELEGDGFPKTFRPTSTQLLQGNLESRILASVQVPLPMFNLREAEASQARSRASQRRSDAEAQQQQIDVARLRADARAAAQEARIVELEKAAALTAEVLDMVQKARDAGQVDLQSVLIARDRALRAHIDLVGARRALAEAELELIALNSSAGGTP